MKSDLVQKNLELHFASLIIEIFNLLTKWQGDLAHQILKKLLTSQLVLFAHLMVEWVEHSLQKFS
jgi:hypothetical protein